MLKSLATARVLTFSAIGGLGIYYAANMGLQHVAGFLNPYFDAFVGSFEEGIADYLCDEYAVC